MVPIGLFASLTTVHAVPLYRRIVLRLPTAQALDAPSLHTPCSTRLVGVPAGGASTLHLAPFHRARNRFQPTAKALFADVITTSRNAGW